MVKVKEDLTGKTFGRLMVIKQAEDYVSPSGYRMAQWLCECNCDDKNVVIVTGKHLKEKNGTKSCGCLARETVAKRLKKYNKYDLSGEYGVGWTSNTNKEFYFDLEDYDKIKGYCWFEHIDSDGYRSLETSEKITHKTLKMHYLFGCKGGDHINRNPLDNRRKNLRQATALQNGKNKSKGKKNVSGVIGVHWYKEKQMWRASIGYNNQVLHIGYFDNKEDAIKARLEAEKRYFGEFAPQQHLYNQYNIN